MFDRLPFDFGSYDDPVLVAGYAAYRKEGEWYARDMGAAMDSVESYFCRVTDAVTIKRLDEALLKARQAVAA